VTRIRRTVRKCGSPGRRYGHRVTLRSGGRLTVPDILQPAEALLFLDWNAGQVDRVLAGVGATTLESVGPLELLVCPELDSGQPQRQAAGGNGQAGVHTDTKQRSISRLACLNMSRFSIKM